MTRALRSIAAATLLAIAIGCSTPPIRHTSPKGAPRDAVILLHGLARTSRSMDRMAQALAEAGYAVYPLAYPSREKSVEQISEEDLGPLIAQVQTTEHQRIHFVAHSLGNIVLRQYFASHAMTDAGRIVMLGPPNQGSEIVDKLGSLTLFEWINGPSGLQLGTSSNSLPNRLPVPPCDVGVIAGTRTINPFLSSLIPGTDDGKVAVERTKLDGMADFTTVPSAHPFLMKNEQAIQLTLEFLRTGTFSSSTPNSP